jgi:DNA ligase (NAD+)
VAASVVDFLARPQSRAVLEKLRRAGLQLEEEGGGADKPLAGRTVVITGTLEGYTRNQAAELLRRAGARVAGSVSKNTDYLVAGEAAGSKRKRAEDLGVPVLDEAGLEKLLKEGAG